MEVGGDLLERRVRVRIEVAEPMQHLVPRLKRSTKRYEVFEVDGFVFKRRREDCKQEQLDCTAVRAEVLEPSEVQKASNPAVRRDEQAVLSPAPEFAAPEGLAYESPSCASAQPEDATDASDRRLQTRVVKACEGICEELLNDFSIKEAGQPAADAVESTLQAWLDAIRTCRFPRLAQNAGNCNGGNDANGEMQLRKATLRTMLSFFEKEENEWILLRNQLPEPGGEPSTPNIAWAGMDGAFTGDAEAEQAKAELSRARKEAHRHLALQVEAYSGLVNGVEALAHKAEHSCSVLQAEYHQQKFRVFPHIDSPASLIKGLADRVPATASQVK